MIDFINPKNNKTLKKKDEILYDDEGNIYKIIDSIPRFVESLNYTKNFSIQWEEFQKTQIDSQSKKL